MPLRSASRSRLAVGLSFLGLVGLTQGCSTPASAPPAPPAWMAELDRPVRVAFLLLDGVYNSELVAPWDVFHHTASHARPGMQVLSVGRSRDLVTSYEGIRMLPDHDLASAPPFEVLVVPSGEHSMGRDLEDARLVQWVRERGAAARVVMSVCDGAFVLAEAGLLAGHACTTYPGDVDALRQRYPGLDVREGVSFVVDGSTITGVGGARSYDPAMHLVEAWYGAGVARGVARGLVLDRALR